MTEPAFPAGLFVVGLEVKNPGAGGQNLIDRDVRAIGSPWEG
jgi:hypothetical protein